LTEADLDLVNKKGWPLMFGPISGNCSNYFHVHQHEMKKETHSASKCAFKSKGPDDERFYISLPVKFYGDEELHKTENQGILKSC
jgi:hypothetical protein